MNGVSIKMNLLGLVLGPLVFLAVFLMGGMIVIDVGARTVLALVAWMVVWWITNAIPLYATALLPLVVLPASNVMQIGSIAVNYADRTIFLLLGSLMLARAIEMAGLHRRFAIRMLLILGNDSKSMLGGFILVTALLSAFMSNTVVAAMMIPLALSIISVMEEGHRRRIAPALMIVIAYSASIGGVITLVGTPPNLIFASIASNMGYDVTFLSWLPIGLPVGSILLLLLWLYLLYVHRLRDVKIIESRDVVINEANRLGRISRREKAVLAVFIATIAAWMSRSVWGSYLPSIDDAVIAVSAALLLFAIRVKDSDESKEDGASVKDKGRAGVGEVRLLTWDEASRIPWGVLVLIGGSLALANAFTATGLDKIVASSLAIEASPSLMVLFITAVTVFITELMSNTAVATLMLPVVSSVAEHIGMEPLQLMLAATLAATLSFMLPVATPPNAMAFASGYLTVAYMIRMGFIMNLLSIAVITAIIYIITPYVRF
ncbi:Sodium-dependent dicarboxylate transporter SdcS [Candidatus Nitrosocaldus cavascurensis]|uniref:Sodium-dependent dicarboxylate transporter SdcS n=2 Tax=Candidatus Nitrosocaldaceae TaxID=1968910 RepID=A0A2K5ASH4_9ARCH|nr:Sodium-dependent dicarboxylate transporter SdcS [Candidatus Nitrosocaldus cavascurensis]